MPSITRRQSVHCYTFRNEILMSTKAILIKIYDRNIINEDNSICHGELLLKPFFIPLRSENDIDSINYKQFNYCCRFLKLLFCLLLSISLAR